MSRTARGPTGNRHRILGIVYSVDMYQKHALVLPLMTESMCCRADGIPVLVASLNASKVQYSTIRFRTSSQFMELTNQVLSWDRWDPTFATNRSHHTDKLSDVFAKFRWICHSWRRAWAHTWSP